MVSQSDQLKNENIINKQSPPTSSKINRSLIPALSSVDIPTKKDNEDETTTVMENDKSLSYIDISTDTKMIQHNFYRKTRSKKKDQRKTTFNNYTFTSGCQLYLLCASDVVGTAFLPLSTDGNVFTRHLHGYDLKQSEKGKEDLIVVTKISVTSKYQRKRFPYQVPGQEGTPAILKDMFKSGLYTPNLVDTQVEHRESDV